MVVTVVASVIALVLFMSGSVDVNHLVGVTTDGLDDVADSVVSLNPDMVVEITQQIGETARTTQEWADGAAEEAARVAEEHAEEAAMIAAELEAADKTRHLEAAKEAMSDINEIRTRNGVPQIPFDEKAHQLALARVNDMRNQGYFAHTNPWTGTCADVWKHQYGFARHEYVAENMGDGYFSYTAVIDGWMGSPGHKTNLLWPTHYGGAVACEGTTCVFLGVNRDMYGAGCY